MITILEETPEKPITLMGRRAGVCWGGNIGNDEKNYKRGLECIQSGHHRVMEYVNVEMIIDGYSARVIREWYTHIGGAPTRLQASTRYIDYERGFSFVTPPSIRNNVEALTVYQELMYDITGALQKLEALGIPREDSALGLPLGMTTKIVDKRNVRNLMDMSHQRMCSRAYHEYRHLFDDIRTALSEYSDEWKYIVDHYLMPKCKYMGFCKERYTCGMMPRRQVVEGE